MDDKIDQLTLNVMEMSVELSSLREQVEHMSGMLAKLLEGGSVSPETPITYEKIPLTSPIEAPDEIVGKALKDMGGILGEAFLFRKYYLSHDRDPPIRKVNQRRIDYWNGSEWIQADRKKVTTIICKNIQKCYMKFNKLDTVGREAFKQNQQRVVNLLQKASQTELIERILDMV